MRFTLSIISTGSLLVFTCVSPAWSEPIEVKSPIDGIVVELPPTLPKKGGVLSYSGNWTEYDLAAHEVGKRLKNTKCRVYTEVNISEDALSFSFVDSSIALSNGIMRSDVPSVEFMKCDIFMDGVSNDVRGKVYTKDPFELNPEKKQYNSLYGYVGLTEHTFEIDPIFSKDEQSEIMDVAYRARMAAISKHDCNGEPDTKPLLSIAPVDYEGLYLGSIQELLFLVDEMDYLLADIYRFVNKIGPRNEANTLARSDVAFYPALKNFGENSPGLDREVRYKRTRMAAFKSNAYKSISDLKRLLASSVNDVANATADVYRTASLICLGTIPCPRDSECESFVPKARIGLWAEKGDVVGLISYE